ncbi:Uncharacterized protein dnl_20050 [Desulfonema limicola]|uniref:Uncharacterized protein n=2 Tax=Desulfonema limicola TaxID=45656 RepID=A0A975B6J4_9BACT|nr:Uncharacterized protein dnl_20050 [Desulfonema limicola]
MLNFDLAETKAGKELINMGLIEGLEKGEKKGEKKGRLQKARELLIWSYEEKWGEPPEYITKAVRNLSENHKLNELFKIVLKTNNKDSFERSVIQAAENV